MKIQALRTAAWAGACCLALTALSCDALNPALVGQLGGDASSVGVEPTGSIVVVLNNQTGKPATLVYDTESNLPGGGQVTQAGNMMTTSDTFALTFDCNTTAVILQGVSTGVTTTQPTGGGTTALAVNEFRRPALQCGSVIFVNIPVIGSPTADLLP